jgi:hypothetical protein
MQTSLIFSLIIAVSLFSCQETAPIEGLWIVKSVTVGNENLTPNARWTRFKADHTQESGNGRFQHSYGTWALNPESSELSITNSNGLDDPNEPFTISINQNEMTWERTEEGQKIKVNLVRSFQLPETYGDQILGLWQLEKAVGDNKYFNESDTNESSAYLFFRWDKRFVIESEKGRVNGVYNVHGHRPEVELIPYGDEVKRDFWRIEFEGDHIALKLLNTDSTITRTFKRIRNFPE